MLTEFLAEAEDAVEELYGELAALRAPRSEGRARRESLARLFRRVHTLKGSASTAGLTGVASLAHEVESLLEAARAGRLALDARAVELFGETVAALEESLERAARGESAPPPRDLVERLRGLAPAQGAEAAGVDETGGGAGFVDESFAGEASASLDAAERGRLRAAVAEGARACAVTVSFPLEDFDERFRLLSDALSEAGEIISTLPLTMPDAPERVGFRVLYATRETRAQTAERAARFGASVEELGARPNEPKERESARHASQGASVRVALDDLDDLISSAHAVFNDALAALEAAAGGDADERAARVRRSFYEVEERLIALRMTTARRTLERAARAGSRVARAEGREVDFEIVGGDVRLDRSVAELVADPLLHLVRNAVDHGVEPESERVARGKPAAGRVRLEAESEAGLVLLRVSDDGRGVDAEAVARAAE
ncbi:MAG TPA: Hpt domain-containing protein, partial [Pyrinomonadaceae bacterium]|nr:Hpt domain-containing protein [Pyrinomonadaceae bacterium]